MKKTSKRILIGLVVLASNGIPSTWTDASAEATASASRSCRQGGRGRPIKYEKVGSYPTADDARAHFEEWIAFYQDFFELPEDLPVRFEYRLRQLQGDLLHG